MSMSIHGLSVILLLIAADDQANLPNAGEDKFGIRMLHATAPHGREWFANWNSPRVVPSGKYDPLDPIMRNSEGDLHIAEGVASAKAGKTRLFILTPKNSPTGTPVSEWRNVEMTIYARRGNSTSNPSYQALMLSARSGERHNDDVPCDGTSYHSTARFDGKWGFKKEIWHTGGYTNLRPVPTPRPWSTVPPRQWIGMKFICRNMDNDQHVQLQAYVDADETNQWKLVAEYVDVGGWEGATPGCDRRIDEILTNARPAVYFRTDYVDVELKKFSVREILPLP